MLTCGVASSAYRAAHRSGNLMAAPLLPNFQTYGELSEHDDVALLTRSPVHGGAGAQGHSVAESGVWGWARGQPDLACGIGLVCGQMWHARWVMRGRSG